MATAVLSAAPEKIQNLEGRDLYLEESIRRDFHGGERDLLEFVGVGLGSEVSLSVPVVRCYETSKLTECGVPFGDALVILDRYYQSGSRWIVEIFVLYEIRNASFASGGSYSATLLPAAEGWGITDVELTGVP